MNLVIDDVKRVVATTLQIGPRADSMHAATTLLGAIPELDSMAVVSLITALEEQFGIVVDDDEIGAEAFETLGSLAAFVERTSKPLRSRSSSLWSRATASVYCIDHRPGRRCAEALSTCIRSRKR